MDADLANNVQHGTFLTRNFRIRSVTEQYTCVSATNTRAKLLSLAFKFIFQCDNHNHFIKNSLPTANYWIFKFPSCMQYIYK